MTSSVASNNQPSTEGQHGHGATQRQKISGFVHLEADGLFECSNNQAHNNRIGQIVLQALEAVHRENVGVLLFATPPGVDQGLKSPAGRCHSQRSVAPY